MFDQEVLAKMRSPEARITDPTPVDPEHIANLMRSNFPEEALRWVFHGSWIGVVNIPWDRIDRDDIDKWAASHQPSAVARFKRKILARNGKVKPSVCIQGHDGHKAVVIDGHHRAIAHHELGRPVRAYVGTIHGQKWINQALETHTSQEHQGASPQNKSAEPVRYEGVLVSVDDRITLTAGELAELLKGDAETLRQYWTHEAHGGPTDFAYADEIKWGTPGDFMRAVALLKEHAHMTDEQAKGYANLLHHRALGYWPAEHAKREHGE
jgi:hypothetical protein